MNVNGTLYFGATNEVGGIELWKSDGTFGGTVQVKDIFAGPLSSNPNYLANVNGTLYFRARDAASGYELWKSDGTTAGTVQVKDIYAGEADSNPGSLTNVNGTLYFRATDATGGFELWKSDGTAAGTVQVKDIGAGIISSFPRYLTNASGTLYFHANDGVIGNEVWKSDGTAAGTVLVTDIAVPGASDPFQFTFVDDVLFVTATTAQFGSELYSLKLNFAPTFSQSSYPFSVNGKSLLGATVGIATATDPNAGDTLTYSIVNGNSLSAFAINPTTGRITIQNPNRLPKIVAPATSVIAPVLTIQVSDGLLVSTATVTVTVKSAPQSMVPIAAAKTTTFQLRENNTVGATAATLTGSPAYTGQILANWNVSDSPGGPASSNFNVKSFTATGAVIGAKTKLSFENRSSYTLYVSASDSLDSTKIVTTPITINITNVNDAPQLSLTNGLAGLPTFTSGTPIALVSRYKMNEHSIATASNTPKNGDVLFTLNAQDDDQTSSSLVYAMTGAGVTKPSTGVFVDRTGAMKFEVATRQVTVLDATKLDFETFKNGIPLAFTVADNGLPGTTPRVLTSKATVTLLLNDLNDAPTFATRTLTVARAENNLANALVIKAAATDGDTLDGVTQPLTYSLVSVLNGTGANVTSLFSIHPTTGEIRVIAANQFDFESPANKLFTLTVRASESGANGLTTAQSVLGDQVITLKITDANERPTAVFTPVNGSPSVGPTGSVTINLASVRVGSIIGSLAITDPDTLAALATFGKDTIVVTVVDNSSTTAPAFSYRANSNPRTGGSLRVNNLTILQSKVENPFSVRFTIKDKNGLSGAMSFTLTLTINVTNTASGPS